MLPKQVSLWLFVLGCTMVVLVVLAALAWPLAILELAFTPSGR